MKSNAGSSRNDIEVNINCVTWGVTARVSDVDSISHVCAVFRFITSTSCRLIRFVAGISKSHRSAWAMTHEKIHTLTQPQKHLKVKSATRCFSPSLTRKRNAENMIEDGVKKFHWRVVKQVCAKYSLGWLLDVEFSLFFLHQRQLFKVRAEVEAVAIAESHQIKTLCPH